MTYTLRKIGICEICKKDIFYYPNEDAVEYQCNCDNVIRRLDRKSRKEKFQVVDLGQLPNGEKTTVAW